MCLFPPLDVNVVDTGACDDDDDDDEDDDNVVVVVVAVVVVVVVAGCCCCSTFHRPPMEQEQEQGQQLVLVWPGPSVQTSATQDDVKTADLCCKGGRQLETEFGTLIIVVLEQRVRLGGHLNR